MSDLFGSLVHFPQEVKDAISQEIKKAKVQAKIEVLEIVRDLHKDAAASIDAKIGDQITALKASIGQ